MSRTLLVNGMTVDDLLAMHRATFGAARMENEPPAPPADAPPAPAPADPPADPADLGDAGKAALAAERTAKAAAEKRAKAAETELEKLRKSQQTDAEKALEQAKAEGTAAALAPAKARVLNAELKAAAKGVLADPADAVRFADLVALPDVDDELNVDTGALEKAVAKLIELKPHLAAKGDGKPKGSADQGHRDDAKGETAPGVSRLRAAYAASSSTT